MITCKVCSIEFSTYRRLCKHVRDAHKLTSRLYYDENVKRDGEGECEYCRNPTQFQTISEGYRSSCNECRSQKAKDFRSAQRKNPEKHKAFVNKVSQNQKRIWEKRKATGEAGKIRQKIGQTIKSNNSKLTAEQRAEKFAWMNKLPADERAHWKNTILLNTGCHVWWKTATEEEKQAVVFKRVATLSQTILEIVQQWHLDKQSYRKYCEAVEHISRMSYFKHKDSIDPFGLRGPGYHLDHIFSKKAGFLQGVDPYIIGHRHNLRVISAHENCTKSAKCSITLNQLLEKIND